MLALSFLDHMRTFTDLQIGEAGPVKLRNLPYDSTACEGFERMVSTRTIPTAVSAVILG